MAEPHSDEVFEYKEVSKIVDYSIYPRYHWNSK